MQVGYVKIGDFRQISRHNSKTSTVASVVNLVRFIAPSVHLCLQHVCRAGSKSLRALRLPPCAVVWAVVCLRAALRGPVVRQHEQWTAASRTVNLRAVPRAL